MKMSQAFAAFRTSLITNEQFAIANELVPVFNARCEDIRRKHEEDFQKYKNQAKADNLKKSLTYDLVLHRKQVLDVVQQRMEDQINERLAADKAELIEEEIPQERGRPKKVLTAKFPDGSMARVPQALWIDYNQFDRV